MKWFKHFTDTHRECDVASLIFEAMGMEGYGRYMVLLEEFVAKLEHHECEPKARFTEKQLRNFLKCNKRGLKHFLEGLMKIPGIQIKEEENVLEIELTILSKSLAASAISSNQRKSSGGPRRRVEETRTEETRPEEEKIKKESDCEENLSLCSSRSNLTVNHKTFLKRLEHLVALTEAREAVPPAVGDFVKQHGTCDSSFNERVRSIIMAQFSATPKSSALGNTIAAESLKAISAALPFYEKKQRRLAEEARVAAEIRAARERRLKREEEQKNDPAWDAEDDGFGPRDDYH